MDKINCLSFLILNEAELLLKNKKEKMLILCSLSIAIVKNRLLFFYFYSVYNNQKDIKWIKTKTKKWINKILTVNK